MTGTSAPAIGFWRYVWRLLGHTGQKLKTSWPKHLAGLVVAAGLPGVVTYVLTNDRKGAETTFYVAAVVTAITFVYEVVYFFFIAGRDALDAETRRAADFEAETRRLHADLAEARSQISRPWLRAEYYDEWYEDEEEERQANVQGLRFRNYGTSAAIDITFDEIPLPGGRTIKPSILRVRDVPPGESADMPLFLKDTFAKIAKALELPKGETIQLKLVVRYWAGGPQLVQFTTDHALVWRGHALRAHVVKPDEQITWTDLSGVPSTALE
jgi:hypothetical protein